MDWPGGQQVNRHSRALLTILIVAAVGLPYWFYSRRSAGPPGPGTPPPAALVRGGAIVATSRTDPPSFNRIAHQAIATEIFALATQGRLVRINRETQELEPWLAETWRAGADGKTFTLTLRDGVQWSDGTPFTSADVAFTFAALYDPRTESPITSALLVNGKPLAVATPDARTVVVTYPDVFGPGIRLLDLLPIMPKHKLATALAGGTFAKAWAADTPPSELVSLGPFKLTEYKPGERLIFERNPRYWRRDSGGVQLPYADRLTIELVPAQDAELVRLQSGQSDFTQQPLRATDIEGMRGLKTQGRVQLLELGVSPEADSLIFNLRPTRWARDPRAAWLSRKEFRQAISHAVDREVFANTVFLGAAVPINGPVTPGNARWFWPSVPRYEFSKDKALALLSGIGLSNRDQDPWLEDDKGVEARFTLLTFRGNTVLERSAAVVGDALREVGIAVDIVPLEPNVVRQHVVEGDFEVAMIQFTASDPDPALSRDFWASSGSAHFWNSEQKTPSTDWERQIDDLMIKQAATMDDQERRRLFNDVQRIFAENLPIIYFAAPRVFIGTSARVTNLHPSLTRPPLMWSVDTMAVRPAETKR
jgi:peptide/nickel transport system substrate-binding protein